MKSMRRSRGDVAGAKVGASFGKWLMVNVGTESRRPSPGHIQWVGGAGTSSAVGVRRGGAVVVLRARESLVHGEGRQRSSWRGIARVGDIGEFR